MNERGGDCSDLDSEGNLQEDVNDVNPAGLFSDVPEGSTETAGEDRFQRGYRTAWEEIRRLEGTEVSVGNNRDEIVWTVVNEVAGCGIDWEANQCRPKDPDFDTKSLADALLLMWPGDIWEQLELVNRRVREENKERKRKNGRTVKEVSKKELLTFLALIVAATQYSARGINLWANDEEKTTKTFSKAANFSQYMVYTCFTQIKSVVPAMMEGKSKNNGN